MTGYGMKIKEEVDSWLAWDGREVLIDSDWLRTGRREYTVHGFLGCLVLGKGLWLAGFW